MQDEMLSYQWKEDTRISDRIELEQSKKLIAGYKPEFRCYRSLMLMNEAKKVLNLISIGDGVVIACGESKQDFYLAQVSSLYDTGESDGEMFATVIWYFKKEEIPKTKLPRRTFNNEVFLCTANAENVVDVETIINKCAIVYSESPVPINGESEESVSTYFYRKIFNGIKVSNYKPKAENKTSRRKTNGQQERASAKLDKNQTKKADPVITKTPLKSTENTKE
uniref:BAH domain-containing protein n=1 Tax=Ciona savignyi TaxID=51511 RepID=H2ZNF4_CIOSA